MSTAHTCFRSALTQAFRPSNRGTAACYSVASFLVPAVARPPKRSFSAGRYRLQEEPRPANAPREPPKDDIKYEFPPKPSHRALKFRIRLPPEEARGDIEQWLKTVDRALPTQLRRCPSEDPDVSHAVTPTDLALVINAAQDAAQDILGHLGLVERRWQAVVWMVKKLVEDGRRSIEPPVYLDTFVNMVWPDHDSTSLKDLTEYSIRTQRARPSQRPKLSLDDFTSARESMGNEHTVVKRALGQLWRSLGSMILAAAERNIGEGAAMPHVLEIIAHLHHVGYMPDSVYTYRPNEDKYALQQPPTLHMLSSEILTALSDASWKAHEASVKLGKDKAEVSYFLGHEIPGSRYKVAVAELAPELWLELVLWSCLHGGWSLDGLAILEQMASKRREHGWGLISWREIMLAEEQNSSAPSRVRKLFPMKGDLAASAEDRARTRRTISSEIVTAFVDALVQGVRVGVGYRGSDPEFVITQLRTLKGFLDSNNLSLGSTAWDAIMARLLESGAFVPEKRPETLLRLFELAPGFGAEVGTVNTSATMSVEVPYFFEPTTLPLNLLHRTMRAYIRSGDMKGAMDTLMLLQQYTDGNRQKSLHEFFEMLKHAIPRKDQPFTNQLPPVDFPAFDINLPVPLRAKLLDLATETKIYDLGRWFLFAQDIDGPLIGRELYNHRNVAASIVSFGTQAGENDLVMNIVKRVSAWNEKEQQQRMPAEVLTAMFCSQIRLHRWESVQSMQRYVTETSKFRPRPVILSTFAAELFRLSGGPKEELLKAQDAFAELLFAWEAPLMSNLRNELYCTLAIMSTVDDTWKEYCSQFMAVSSRQGIKLAVNEFNQILRGVLESYDSAKGREVVQTWCYLTPDTFEAHRAPGGLVRMPRFMMGKAAEYNDRPEDIELVQESGATLVLQGRLHPNHQTIWAILRKIQEEVGLQRWQGEEHVASERAKVRDTLRWAARLLHHLGSDYEDIMRDMGSSLAELAELEPPAAPKDFGNLDGADPEFGHAAFRQLA